MNAIASVTWTIRSGPGFVHLKAKKFLQMEKVTLIEIPYFVPNIDDYLYEQLVVHGYLANVIFID